MELATIERSEKLKLFISNYFADVKYIVEPMRGDAGLRNYHRTKTDDGKSFVIMDCPPTYAEVSKFIQISDYLLKENFSAPTIFAQDIENGFLILEDFGNVSLKDYLQSDNQGIDQKNAIYHLIIDLLISLQNKVAPTFLKDFNDEILCNELDLFINWYIPYKYNQELKIHEFNEFIELWQKIFSQIIAMPSSIILRDFHLENMMYLEMRESINKIGLLDFQDALIGSPIYDLVSVLEDARFEVPRDMALKLVDYYAEKKALNKESVLINYHILGAQRNCRILGVFARKAVKENDDYYLQFIPRVEKYLEYDLSHPILNNMKEWLKNLKTGFYD
ncbi:MAG: hypothetical protein EKK63_02895 [Acinetobacter sp.]|uniref:aminoglycoside phosphotransferase family protein n=1 Tax=Acinetobacter sp. TaxID=472 RepID=UPI000FB25094|nr:phosphotransferase [Acinetobacter sp.]RUP42005.1 MAG: hypothetical protein EKK63_02895 [Acinetobacter sp.]